MVLAVHKQSFWNLDTEHPFAKPYHGIRPGTRPPLFSKHWLARQDEVSGLLFFHSLSNT